MRRLRPPALAANAAFIAYGTSAELLPVMVLHLALVPVNLWRPNQAFQRKPGTQDAEAAPAQRVGRQPSGWTPARRVARVSRRQADRALTFQQSKYDTSTDTAADGPTDAPRKAW
jgi:hypothetical protein